ncbi:hypothetical protein Dimus_037366, partial [Dionaea muscipula]
MKRATADSGEFRVRVECRRSSRLSPSIPPDSSDLGVGVEDGLSPIEEGLESFEETRPIVEGDGLPMVSPSPGSGSSAFSSGAAIRLCQTTTEDGGGSEMAVGPLRVSGVLPGGGDFQKKEAELQASLVFSPVVDDAPEERLEGAEMLLGREVRAEEVLSSPCLVVLSPSAASCPAVEVAGAAVVEEAGDSQRPASSLVPHSVSFSDCEVGSELLRADGSESVVEVGVGSGGLGVNAATVCSSLFCLPSVHVNPAGRCDVGSVREEVRVPQMAGEALRPQPTDGLWQPPSTSVGPVSERVEKEKGIRGDACVAQEGRG